MQESYKIVVVSDNHGRRDVLENIRHQHEDADCFIHCGDSEMSERDLHGYVHVRGNSDYDSSFPDTVVVPVGNHRIVVTHGHRQIMFGQLGGLVQLAQMKSCDIVCYGHIHVYRDDTIDGIRLLNPGSLRYNRDGTHSSYMIITINGNQITTERVNY